MATKELVSKSAGDIVDYPIDFSALLASGETLASVVSLTVDAGLTDETGGSPAISGGNTVTLVFSGGTEGETYRIVLLVETDMGTPARRFERSFCLLVEVL